MEVERRNAAIARYVECADSLDMTGFAAPDFERYKVAETVGFAGDWHGNTGWAVHAIRTLASRGAKVIYQVGDFGLWGGQDGAAYLRKIQRTLGYEDMVLIVTPGNHENYDMLEKFPLNEYGFMARHDIGRIWFAPRGHIWTHHGAYIASLGGAGSIDVRNRVEGKSWWRQEAITMADVDALKANMDEWGITGIDVMLTHESPAGITLGAKGWAGISPEIEHYCYLQRVLLRAAVDHATPRALIHGHWHRLVEAPLEGMSTRGDEYTAEVVGLNMDSTSENLMTCELAPASGLINKKVIWK